VLRSMRQLSHDVRGNFITRSRSQHTSSRPARGSSLCGSHIEAYEFSHTAMCLGRCQMLICFVSQI